MDEMFQQKQDKIGQVLEMIASIQQQAKMQEMGLAPNSPEGQQMMAPDALKALPELQKFYTETYRSEYQEWAEHQMVIDNDRFYMEETKRNLFKDSLIAGRLFCELQMKEDDYNIRRIHPIQTFYRKSPDVRWIQEGQWAGYLSLMTVPDVLDMYGWMMSEEQMLALNRTYPATSASWSVDGLRPEGMWDATQSYEYNRTGPGIAARQMFSAIGMSPASTGDVVNRLYSESEDMIDTQFIQLVRVSTVYWKSQRKLYELTEIDEDGKSNTALVTDEFVVTEKPVYNTLVYKEKSKNNLIFGQHLDGIWVNEVWGGVKIGPNLPVYGQTANGNNFSPMYLGIRGGKPSKLPFQFKKENQKWGGGLLPICGAVFNDEHCHARSFVDSLQVYQLAVNMTANQILDLMVDELGVIITFDPSSLPQHSMGEDWGPDAFPKWYMFTKDFNFAPVHTGRNEDGTPNNPNSLRVVDASQSNRFLRMYKGYQFWYQQGLAMVGLNQQRMGQPLDREEASGVAEQNMSASYSATEHLFNQFDDFMIRFHQMRTDLSQYFNSQKPSVALQYTTSNAMKMWFRIDGRKLDGREFGVSCVSTPHSRHVMEEIKQMMLKNNTTDLQGTDLMNIVKAENLPELETLIKGISTRIAKDKQAQQQQEQQLQQQEQQHAQQMQQEQQQFLASEKQLDRENALDVAQIQISPKLADSQRVEDTTSALAQNMVQHNQKMDMEREKEINKNSLEKEKLAVTKDKTNAENKRTDAELRNKQTELHIKNKTAQQKKK